MNWLKFSRAQKGILIPRLLGINPRRDERSIPTLASSSNRMCGKGFGVSESQWLTVWLTILGLFQNCFKIRENSPAIA